MVSQTYIESARARGSRPLAIITRHVLPNAIGPAIVQATILMGFALQIEAALSFLGLGAQPPTSSLGVMLADGRDVLTQAPWVEIWPGIAIAIAVLALRSSSAMGCAAPRSGGGDRVSDLLTLEHVDVGFASEQGRVSAVSDVSLSVGRGRDLRARRRVRAAARRRSRWP